MYGALSTLAAATSARSVDHTMGPASPSTGIPFWFSNVMTAALVMTFGSPCVQSDVRSAGRFGQRQAKLPNCGIAALLDADAALPGVNDSGR